MKNLLIQYLYLFAIATIIFLTILGAQKLFACETNKPEQVLCKEGQTTTEQEPCIEKLEENSNINSVVEGIIKLGESGAFPK